MNQSGCSTYSLMTWPILVDHFTGFGTVIGGAIGGVAGKIFGKQLGNAFGQGFITPKDSESPKKKD